MPATTTTTTVVATTTTEEAAIDTSPRCSKGHAMISGRDGARERTFAWRPLNVCDVCGARSTSWRCAEGCDYDLCTACVDDNAAALLSSVGVCHAHSHAHAHAQAHAQAVAAAEAKAIVVEAGLEAAHAHAHAQAVAAVEAKAVVDEAALEALAGLNAEQRFAESDIIAIAVPKQSREGLNADDVVVPAEAEADVQVVAQVVAAEEAPAAPAAFKVQHTPRAPCGPHLEGSGKNAWLSLDAAIAEVQRAGHVIGVACTAIQHSGGKCYFYGPVASGRFSGNGGPHVYTLKPDAQPNAPAADAEVVADAEVMADAEVIVPNEGDGEVAVAAPAVAAPADGKWARHLTQLADMGFTDRAANVQMLEEHGGSVHTVVLQLLQAMRG